MQSLLFHGRKNSMFGSCQFRLTQLIDWVCVVIVIIKIFCPRYGCNCRGKQWRSQPTELQNPRSNLRTDCSCCTSFWLWNLLDLPVRIANISINSSSLVCFRLNCNCLTYRHGIWQYQKYRGIKHDSISKHLCMYLSGSWLVSGQLHY